MDPVTLGVIFGAIGAAAAAVTIVGAITGAGGRIIAKVRRQSTAPTDANIDYEELAKGLLKELAEATQPQGVSSPEFDPLATQATAGTEKLLAQAVELQSQHKEREAIERLLTAYSMDMPPEAKAQLHLLAGNGFYQLSDYGAAEHHYGLSLEAGRAAASKTAEAKAVAGLGVVYNDQGDLAKAEENYKQALAIDRDIGDRRGEAIELGNLGTIYAQQGDLTRAEENQKQALAIDRDIGYRLGEASCLCSLGSIYRDQGHLAKAEDHHKQALAIDRDIGYRLGEAQDLGNLGNVYAQQGDPERAKANYEQALVIDREIAYRLGEAIQLGSLGLLATEGNDHAEACQRLKEALSIFDEIGAGGEDPDTVRAALEKLGCEETG